MLETETMCPNSLKRTYYHFRWLSYVFLTIFFMRGSQRRILFYIWWWDINGLNFLEASVVGTTGKGSSCIDVADRSIGSTGSIGFIALTNQLSIK